MFYPSLTPVLVDDPERVYRSSPNYQGVLFNRTYPTVVAVPYFRVTSKPPPWTFFTDPFVSVVPVVEAYSPQGNQPNSVNLFSLSKPSTRLPEPEDEYKRFNHSVYWQLVRLYAAQLVGYTFTVPDLCDHPWLEWVHPPASAESAIYPFRQIPGFVRGQQFNLYFNQPRPWPVEGEQDTVDRQFDSTFTLVYPRPAVALLMPVLIGLPEFEAIEIMDALVNQPPTVTFQSTTYPIPPVPAGIVVAQWPLPGTPLQFPFSSVIIVSTGLMVLPNVGDSTNYSPVNVVIGDDTPP